MNTEWVFYIDNIHILTVPFMVHLKSYSKGVKREKEDKAMKKIYFTITGTRYYMGDDVFEKGMVV